MVTHLKNPKILWVVVALVGLAAAVVILISLLTSPFDECGQQSIFGIGSSGTDAYVLVYGPEGNTYRYDWDLERWVASSAPKRTVFSDFPVVARHGDTAVFFTRDEDRIHIRVGSRYTVVCYSSP
ncbi:MAG: hypothetical protein ABI758_04990 [Candidatus Woesebacteria bacterium]